MKSIQSLAAVMLLGALSVAGSDVAAAKQRHRASDEGSHGIKFSDGAQKSVGDRGDHGVNGDGAAKNSTAGPLNSNAGNKVNKDGNQNAGGPISEGPMKGGDNLPGKGGPHNAGSAESGKNQIGGREDSSRLDATQPGKIGSADGGKSDIIADGPGHKTQKPSDTTKKITTIFRPHVVRDHQHPTVSGKIERNAIGVTISNNGNSKLGLEPKVAGKINGSPAGIPGPTATMTIPNAGMPIVRRPGNNAVEMAPKAGPIINGTSVSRPGSNLTSVGGPSKNIVGALSGSSFKPRHP
jgi:hypothetical protein